MTINELVVVTAELAMAVEDYRYTPSKKVSKQIRMLLGDIKKNTAQLRATLVAADKAGY